MVTVPNPLRLASTAGRGTLLAAVLASGMAFLDGTVVNVALPHIGTDLHAGIAGLQWTVNGYLLALAALVLFGGALGDRYGRRRVFLVGVAWFTLASLACGLTTGTGALIAARVLQGCGAALLTPGSLALLQTGFAEQDRARAIGTWSGLSGMAMVAGPFLGGWLIDALSWRWIFFLNAPLAVLAVAATLRYVPADRPAAPAGRFDVAGAAFGAVALGAVTYALVDGGTSRPATVAAVAVAVLAAAGFVLVERHRRDAAMLPPRLFARRQFAAINVVTVFVYAAVSGLSFMLVVELQVVSGYRALAAGTALLPLTLLLLGGSRWSAALGRRIGPRLPLAGGAVLAAAGVLALYRVGPHTRYLPDVLPGAVLAGLGMTLLVAPLTAGVLAAAPDDLAGVASGTSNAVARAGSLLAVAALPLAVGLSGDGYRQPVALDRAYHLAVWWIAGSYLAGALAAGLLVRRPGPAGEP